MDGPINQLTEKVIGLAIEVRQQELPLTYKGAPIDCNFRYDVLIENRLLVDVKSVSELHPIFDAQMHTYLQRLNVDYGLILNFNVVLLKDGIRRRIRKGAGSVPT